MGPALLNRTAFLLSLDPKLRDFATPRKTEELVPYSLYDRNLFSAGALATSTAFFNAVATDSRDGNMELAQQIPNPKRFLVTQMRVHVVSIAAAAVWDTGATTGGTIMNDMNLFLSDTQVSFSLGDKGYLLVPTWKLPSGGGLFGMHADAVADTSAGTATNGWPRVKNGYHGAWPIPSNTAFSVALKAPGANTIANDMYVTIVMDGWMIRAKQ